MAAPASAGLHRARPASWLAPDLALSIAVVAVVYLLLAAGASSLFHDADAGWHIQSGERMLSTGSLPVSDPFSFSNAGQPWMAWEWLSDIAAGSVHRVAGLSGVAFVYVFAIGLSVWMWFRLNWAAGGNFLLACLFAAPMLTTTGLHWLARPHVFGWLFTIGTVWFCEGVDRRNRLSYVALVACGTALWANVHGSFILAPLICLIYGFRSWAAAALVGSLCNPYGWNLHRHIFEYLSDSALLDRVGEFQSFNFHADGSLQIIAALLIGLAGGYAAVSARRPERFLMSMVFTVAALRTARMLPIAALILLPLANGSIAEVLTHAQLAPRFRRWLDQVMDYGSGLRALDKTLSGWALVPVFGIALFLVVRATHPGFPPDQFPVTAAASVAALPKDAKLFTSDKFGGYLIYRFDGARKVYFDGRSDFYGAEFLKTYSRLVQARPGWDAEFARQGFTHALLPPDYALVAALEAAGWRETFRDDTAILLKGPQS